MIERNIAIEANNLSKIYRIGIKEDIHDNLAHSILNFMKNPLGNYRKYRSLYSFNATELKGGNGSDTSSSSILWAVKDVSFQIKKGEVLGIIGRNGAGKSTLLKILCRITEPTTGRARVRGRVSSLLEVGTGFHQELTGRENVYLNGTILGMTKAEVRQKFDEIVQFSGVEKFIDTPVKRYSSGMKVRLAFSVAAHLEPDILIIDEVLAVGDADFQRKCLNKMEDVGSQGRTVLFVSHNMSAITRLCDRGILLETGKLALDGTPEEAVREYLKAGKDIPGELIFDSEENAPGNEIVRLRAVKVKQDDGTISPVIDIEQPLRVEMKYQILKPGFSFLPHYVLHDGGGNIIFVAIDQDRSWQKRTRDPGMYTSKAYIPGNLFNEGNVFVDAVLRTIEPDTVHFVEKNAVSFEVVEMSKNNPTRAGYVKSIPGAVRPELKWTTDYTAS